MQLLSVQVVKQRRMITSWSGSEGRHETETKQGYLLLLLQYSHRRQKIGCRMVWWNKVNLYTKKWKMAVQYNNLVLHYKKLIFPGFIGFFSFSSMRQKICLLSGMLNFNQNPCMVDPILKWQWQFQYLSYPSSFYSSRRCIVSMLLLITVHCIDGYNVTLLNRQDFLFCLATLFSPFFVSFWGFFCCFFKKFFYGSSWSSHCNHKVNIVSTQPPLRNNWWRMVSLKTSIHSFCTTMN